MFTTFSFKPLVSSWYAVTPATNTYLYLWSVSVPCDWHRPMRSPSATQPHLLSKWINDPRLSYETSPPTLQGSNTVSHVSKILFKIENYKSSQKTNYLHAQICHVSFKYDIISDITKINASLVQGKWIDKAVFSAAYDKGCIQDRRSYPCWDIPRLYWTHCTK